MSQRKPGKQIKRAIDITGSLVALLILGIPMLLVGAAIKLTSKGPALFKQERVGIYGKPFTLYKFRTMRMGSDDDSPLFDGARVTSVGKYLRKWRIDELPQLLNVLKGEMSIVGPRPTLPYQVERYDSEQRQRLNFNPGITGWAQIHGDKAISWPERISYDIEYVNNWSLMLDLKIMLLTPFALLRIKNINVVEEPPEDSISSL